MASVKDRLDDTVGTSISKGVYILVMALPDMNNVGCLAVYLTMGEESWKVEYHYLQDENMIAHFDIEQKLGCDKTGRQ